MKITKQKEIITEDIEVKPGIYYFEDEDIISHKFTLKEPDGGYFEYIMESLYSFSNKLGILIREDGAWDEEGIPYIFKKYIVGTAGKEITEEEYNKERAEILNKLK